MTQPPPITRVEPPPESTDTKRRIARRIALAAAAGLALLSLVETGLALLSPLRVAKDADWAQAAAWARARFRGGDLIVFAPGWSDPIGRSHLGDLMPVEMIGRSDDARYDRILELSVRGARSPDTRADDAFFVEKQRFGKVTAALYERHHVARPRFDFTARFDEARGVQTPGGDPWANPCVKQPRMLQCSTVRIEPRTLEIDYAPRHGILAPVDGRLLTSLEWSAVPLGDELVLFAGLHDYYARKSADGPVLFKVFVDGAERLAGVVRNRDGWKRFSVDTHERKGTSAKVRIEYGSPAPAARNFGFHAETRDAA